MDTCLVASNSCTCYIYKHIYQGKSEMLHYTAEGGDGKMVGALLEAKGGSWDLLGELG